MHDPRLTYIYMCKNSLLQCIHKAAAQHGTPSISPISLQSKTKLGFIFVERLWYGSSWPRSQSERGKSNLECKKNTFILSNYNELVDFLSSGMETPCMLVQDHANFLLCQQMFCCFSGKNMGCKPTLCLLFCEIVYRTGISNH